MKRLIPSAPGFARGPFRIIPGFVPGPMRACPQPSPTPGQSPGLQRRGLTLIELLITMVIMAIIAAAIMGTASAAMENARRTRTQQLVTRIHTLLMERMDSYASRRLNVRTDWITALDVYVQAGSPNQRAMRMQERGQMMADARLLAIRELMKYEMPDRWSDIVGQPLQSSSPQLTAALVPAALDSLPALTQIYLRQLRALNSNGNILANEGAECLYMVVMYATGDGEARTLFSDQDIGDTDGDGAREILDGWGRPISYVRWPAGFTPSPLMSGDSASDHDPFDLYHRDAITVTTPQISNYPSAATTGRPSMQALVNEIRQRNAKALANNTPRWTAFRLIPLVYSAGPDGIADIHLANNVVVRDPYGPYQGANGNSGTVEAQLGTPLDRNVDPNSNGDNWKDNIHSHVLLY